MRKTNTRESDYKITVDITALQGMLSLGRQTCDRIGEEAGAVIRIGRRKLYNVKKIEAFLDGNTEIKIKR